MRSYLRFPFPDIRVIWGCSKLRTNGEVCDDGNDGDGDGCSADCKYVEAGFICPTPGQPCVNTVKCGDGKIEGNEQCDDGNTAAGDGCSATCTLETGYTCPLQGSPCITKCGDGILAASEQCDDGNLANGDGCSATCRWESGWACAGPAGHYACHLTTCGDGIKEGTEACDPGTGPGGTHDTGNGCSPFCTLEPNCAHAGGACTSTCGDGILLISSGEQCDDGNTIDGDGCSSTCQVEPGYQCTQPPLGQSLSVPVVYRDFNARGDANGFVDFNPGATDQNAPITGLVATKLDALGKPVYVGPGGGGQNAGFVSSAATYAQWYRDDPAGMGAVNRTIVDHIKLWENGSGGYVNRWGANGEQWSISAYSNIQWCSNSSNACSACPSLAGGVCLPTCTPWSNSQTCIAVETTTAYDGNPVFFPIDPVSYSAGGPNHTATGALLMSPISPYQLATIAPSYGGNWNDEPNGTNHNFAFTSEIRYWFLYDATRTYQLDFTGDDDVWVFLNRTLAVDLGSIHTPQSGSVTISAATAGQFGLVSGNLYEIAVFQDERQTTSSTFKLTLAGFNLTPSVCTPVCGNGVATPPEQCANSGGYGKCAPGCVYGPRCGDGVVEKPYEQCDDGTNSGGYGQCAPGCVLGPYCGDGIVQPGYEECDNGANNGTAGNLCSSACKNEMSEPK